MSQTNDPSFTEEFATDVTSLVFVERAEDQSTEYVNRYPRVTPLRRGVQVVIPPGLQLPVLQPMIFESQTRTGIL